MTPTGSTGTSFLLGIAVSVVASLALWLLLTLPRLATTTQALTIKGASMASNTTVLMIVTAMAVLVLAGVLVAVVYRTRAPKWDELARDQVEEDAIRLRRQELKNAGDSGHLPTAARMATPNSRLTGKHLRQKRFH